ncbi:MAG: GyrI-like domain-containing protein, partial [Cyclobacteriaceae bacterium]
GKDYERGLMMLKDYVEDDKVHSRLDFKGIESYPGCSFVGIRTRCNSDSLSSNMRNDFGRLRELVGPEDATGKEFSIYHKWDMVRDEIEYTACIPVDKAPENMPSDVNMGQIPRTQVHTIRHIGPYTHLGNAWSAQNSYHRNKAFKINRKIDPFEVYQNTPEEVPGNDLITHIHFPSK